MSTEPERDADREQLERQEVSQRWDKALVDAAGALHDFVSQPLQRIPVSSLVEQVVHLVKTRTRKFGELCLQMRLALIAQRQLEDADLCVPELAEPTPEERVLLAGGEAALLRAAYDKFRCCRSAANPARPTTLGRPGTADRQRPTRHRLQSALTNLLRLHVPFELFEHLFNHMNESINRESTDGEIDFEEFCAVLAYEDESPQGPEDLTALRSTSVSATSVIRKGSAQDCSPGRSRDPGASAMRGRRISCAALYPCCGCHCIIKV